MDSVNGGDIQMKRRTVVKGAAWAAPVVTMGVAAPMAAASPPPVFPELTQDGSCKHSNWTKQGYHIGLTWTNTLDDTTTVTVTSIVVTPESETPVSFSGYNSFDVDSGDTKNFYYDSCETPNMANGSAVVQYTYTVDGEVVVGEVPLTILDLPPCQGSIGLNHAEDVDRCSEVLP